MFFSWHSIFTLSLRVGLFLSRVDRVLAPLGFPRRFFGGFGYEHGKVLLYVSMGTISKTEACVQPFILPTCFYSY